MKGTLCGIRATRLAALSALALVAAPSALAGVGETAGLAAPAVPAVAQAVPAAPAPTVAVPAVATPAVPAQPAVPALAPAAQTATAAVAGAANPVAAKVVTTAKNVAKTAVKPVAAKVVATAKSVAKTAVKPVAQKAPSSAVHQSVAKAAAKAGVEKDGTITATTSTTVDLRHLSNTSSNPLMGCYGSYQLCQTIPDFPYAANNDCNNEQVSFVGQFTQWTQTSVNALSGTVTVHMRSYFVGFKGQGDQGNVYTGVDTQNDFQRSFALTGGITVDHRDYEVLIVTKKNPLDPAQNEFEYFHTITSVDPLDPAHPQIAVEGPFIVCTCGAKHSRDNDYRGKYNDDDSGDKHHHHEDYKGYNDDSNNWDD